MNDLNKIGIYNFALFFTLAMMVSSCGPKVAYEKSISVGNSWSYDESLVFEINIEDLDQEYDLHLLLEHSDIYSYQNLYVLIETTYPDSKVLKDEVSLQLADNRGEFNGKCSGEKCTVTIVLQEKFKFQSVGKHTITIAQYSRNIDLEGVYGGTLKLVHHEN